jgi:hypothetical protein
MTEQKYKLRQKVWAIDLISNPRRLFEGYIYTIQVPSSRITMDDIVPSYRVTNTGQRSTFPQWAIFDTLKEAALFFNQIWAGMTYSEIVDKWGGGKKDGEVIINS